MIAVGNLHGTITRNSIGYALSAFNDNNFAYLDAPKTTGKWYWEYQYGTDPVEHMTGVADDVVTFQTWAGYQTANAGMYANGEQFWADFAWTGRALTANGGFSPITGDILGLALDMTSATKTLKLYLNNVLIGTVSWTQALTLYPIFGFQTAIGFPTSQVQLGPHCTYPAPAGYIHL